MIKVDIAAFSVAASTLTWNLKQELYAFISLFQGVGRCFRVAYSLRKVYCDCQPCHSWIFYSITSRQAGKSFSHSASLLCAQRDHRVRCPAGRYGSEGRTDRAGVGEPTGHTDHHGLQASRWRAAHMCAMNHSPQPDVAKGSLRTLRLGLPGEIGGLAHSRYPGP